MCYKMRVENLERYNAKITDIPKGAFKGQTINMIKIFVDKFGLFGLIGFGIRVKKSRRQLLKKYSNEYEKLKKITLEGANEISYMVSIFNTIAERESRDVAYKFISSVFKSLAKNSMSALYQVDDLIKCEGDVFANYKKMNIAIFKNSHDEFNVKKIEETDNHLRIVLDSCLNVEAGKLFDCPEVAKLGCDHDLEGYPYIEDKVNSIMRRPCTLAKGGDCCDFNFYKKGYEPKGDYKNY